MNETLSKHKETDSTSARRLPRRTGVALLALFALLVAGSCGSGPGADAPHVILISLDTTRADHLGCYGNTEVKTPNLDALAAEGVVFRDVSTAATTTLVSHTSIMAGVWPQRHGVVRNGYVVHDDNLMLAEVLDEAGYHTAGFLGSFALESGFHFDQGFDFWDEEFDLMIRPGDREQNQRRAESVTNAVIDHLGSLGDERLFLFAHYFDAHAPYEPPEPYRSMYGEVPEDFLAGMSDLKIAIDGHQAAALGEPLGMTRTITLGLTRELLERISGEPQEIDRHLASLYAGEISYLDHHLGRLFDFLKEEGIYDDALIVVTADHGETFWEHGDCWNHGLAVYDTTVRVPLIVRFPGGEFSGGDVDAPVSTIDVMPTILRALGMDVPGDVQGCDLGPLVRGEELDRGPIYSIGTQPGASVEVETVLWRNENKAHAIRVGDHKLIYTPYLDFQELYDLAQDPGETANLMSGANPTATQEARRLRRTLDAFRDSARPLSSEFDYDHQRGKREQVEEARKDAARAAQEEANRKLRELGYIGDETGKDD